MAFGVENPVAEYRKMKSKAKQKPAPIDRYIKSKPNRIFGRLKNIFVFQKISNQMMGRFSHA